MLTEKLYRVVFAVDNAAAEGDSDAVAMLMTVSERSLLFAIVSAVYMLVVFVFFVMGLQRLL